MELWWNCPCCGEDVDFQGQLESVFEEDGQPMFSVKEDSGLYFHTIFCQKCRAFWTMSISGMYLDKSEKAKQFEFELNDENVHPNVRKQLEELMDGDSDG